MPTNLKHLVYELYKLNPGIELRFGDPKYDPNAKQRIFSSGDPKKIVLPEGYTADDLGVIRYNNTVVVCVEPLKNINVGHVLPNSEIRPDVTINNSKDLAIVIQKLNPDLIIYFADNNIYYRQLLHGDLGNIVLPDFASYSNSNLQFSCTNTGEVKNAELKNYIEYKGYNSLERMYDFAFNNAEQYIIDKKMLESWDRRKKIKELETKKLNLMLVALPSIIGFILSLVPDLDNVTFCKEILEINGTVIDRHFEINGPAVVCGVARPVLLTSSIICSIKAGIKSFQLENLYNQEKLTTKDLQKLSRKNTQIK